MKEYTEEQFCNLLLSTQREGMDKMIEFLKLRNFFTMPASVKYHGNYEGGLVDHSMHLYNFFNRLVEEYKLDVSHNNIVIAALLHDVCKANLYKFEDGKWKSQFFIFNKGHAKFSLERIQRFIKLEQIEIDLIRSHMGYYSCKEGYRAGEYTIQELKNAQNNVAVKLFYFSDDIVSQCVDKTVTKE